jgi:flavin-dependent dehydrogenase
MSKEILIVGAGLSGLVAGINLSREGHDVRILEAKERIGGNAVYLDSTYISLENSKNFTGVDISRALDPWKSSRIHAYGKAYDIINPAITGAYTVERGRGDSSLENILYRQAVDEGVKVELGNAVSPRDIRSLPPGSIIATGLCADVFRALDIPCRPFYCYLGTARATAADTKVVVYFDRFTREYGYYFQSRGIAGALTFNVHRPLTGAEKAVFRHRLEEDEGIAFDNWNESISEWAAWPLGGWKNLRLFHEDKIITGTLAGAVNPVILFGVHGALVSGRIAAIAVRDRVLGQKAFDKLNPAYYAQTALRNFRQHAPQFLLKPFMRFVLSTYHPRYFHHLYMLAVRPPGLNYLNERKP